MSTIKQWWEFACSLVMMISFCAAVIGIPLFLFGVPWRFALAASWVPGSFIAIHAVFDLCKEPNEP